MTGDVMGDDVACDYKAWGISHLLLARYPRMLINRLLLLLAAMRLSPKEIGVDFLRLVLSLFIQRVVFPAPETTHILEELQEC